MRIVIVGLLAGLAMGCGVDEGGEEAAGVPTSHRTVACREAIDVVDDPGSLYRVHGSVPGFVALPAMETQLGRWGPDATAYEGYRFSKFGLLVRRLRQVTLEIVSAPDEAVLDYGGGSDFEPVHALTVDPCDTEGGEWVVWAGGIWVNEPGCVEVLATSDDEEVSVWLAVGASCNEDTIKS